MKKIFIEKEDSTYLSRRNDGQPQNHNNLKLIKTKKICCKFCLILFQYRLNWNFTCVNVGF